MHHERRVAARARVNVPVLRRETEFLYDICRARVFLESLTQQEFGAPIAHEIG